MGSTPGRGQGGVLGAVPIGGRCPGAFFGNFGRRVLCDPVGYWGRCPYPCPSGLVGLLALAWPGLWFFGLCACLGFLPFCFGLCGREWPSGGHLFCFCLLASAPALGDCPLVLGGAVGHGPLVAVLPALCLLAFAPAGVGVLFFCLGGLLGGLVSGGASGDVQGCPIV